jgi:hypothetical protein
MSEARPVSLAFVDPARGLHGIARAGLTLIFEGASPRAAGGGPEVELAGESYRAVLDDRLELEFAPVSEVAQLAGSRIRVCRVRGRVDGAPVDCLGTAAETVSPPQWEELDALRALSALFDSEHAMLAIARRPHGAPGHGHELVTAALLTGGELRAVEEARLSTVYDGDGRQRSARMELWMPGEDFPRRAAGEAASGTTLELPGLLVNASVFEWRMEGREGVGSYEVTVRAEPQEAA